METTTEYRSRIAIMTMVSLVAPVSIIFRQAARQVETLSVNEAARDAMMARMDALVSRIRGRLGSTVKAEFQEIAIERAEERLARYNFVAAATLSREPVEFDKARFVKSVARDLVGPGSRLIDRYIEILEGSRKAFREYMDLCGSVRGMAKAQEFKGREAFLGDAKRYLSRVLNYKTVPAPSVKTQQAYILEMLRKRGVKGPTVNVNGKMFSVEHYAMTVARTEGRVAQTAATEALCRGSGIGKVMFSNHADPCPECAKLEGMVFDLGEAEFTFADGKTKLMKTPNVEGDPLLSDEYRPPIHPNCEHNLDPVPTSVVQGPDGPVSSPFGFSPKQIEAFRANIIEMNKVVKKLAATPAGTKAVKAVTKKIVKKGGGIDVATKEANAYLDAAAAEIPDVVGLEDVAPNGGETALERMRGYARLNTITKQAGEKAKFGPSLHRKIEIPDYDLRTPASAIFRYSYKHDGVLNKWLRGIISEPWSDEIPIRKIRQLSLFKWIKKTLDSALKKLPKYRGTIYRGVSFDDAEGWIDFVKRFAGGTFIDPGYMSTSIDAGIAQRLGFKGPNTVFMKIKATGKAGHYVTPYSKYSGEFEVLFERGARFRVIKFTDESFKSRYFMKAVVELEEI